MWVCWFKYGCLLVFVLVIFCSLVMKTKAKYLPKLASAEWIGAWGLTEANTGSDAMRMQCTAKKDGDHWVINGTKNWITRNFRRCCCCTC